VAHCHLADQERDAALPFGRQRLPNRAGHRLAHYAIQASAPRRTTLGSRFSAILSGPSTYERRFRWGIEPSFRDTKDLRFGMGMAELRIAEPERRDRLLLISAFAMALLTMLGAAGESLGMDRMLKSNTSKTRTQLSAISIFDGPSAEVFEGQSPVYQANGLS
jgi:hypothetical protein